MKRFALWVAALLLVIYAGGMPFERKETGQLIVVETLVAEHTNGLYRLWGEETQGDGESFYEALENMKSQATGELFLGQMKRIILCGDSWTEEALMQLPEEIPLGARLYQTKQSIEATADGLEDTEKRLNAEERRDKRVPTVAYVQNQYLRDEA